MRRACGHCRAHAPDPKTSGRNRSHAFDTIDLTGRLEDGDGVVSLTLHFVRPHDVDTCAASLNCGSVVSSLQWHDAYTPTGGMRDPHAERWWPHMHGEPTLYPLTLQFDDRRAISQSLGSVGFRRLEVDRGADGAGFALRVNGTSVFCRDACRRVLPAPLARFCIGEFRLPERSRLQRFHRARPDVPYVSNSPSGDAWPLSTNESISHSSCAGAYPRPFNDVRDYYLQVLHGVEPARLRYKDPARYRDLLRAMVTDLMGDVFAAT
jgi:hypothetical protein